jgi:cytochrome oxidase Cu insertion factor (SCO1/SenC/PrrC family)
MKKNYRGNVSTLPLIHSIHMKYFSLVIVILIALSIPSWTQTPAQTIPSFTFFRANGKTFVTNDLTKQRMQLFIFFDSECNHCQRLITQMNKERMLLSPASVIFISMDNWNDINRFAASCAPALRKQKNVQFVRDSLNQFIAVFKPRKYPAMFLYSADKKLMDYEDNENSLFRIERFIKGTN